MKSKKYSLIKRLVVFLLTLALFFWILPSNMLIGEEDHQIMPEENFEEASPDSFEEEILTEESSNDGGSPEETVMTEAETSDKEQSEEAETILTIEIQLGQESFDAGSLFHYHLRLTNDGSADATSISLKSHIPENLIYKSDSSGGVFEPDTNTISWDFEKMLPGESKSIDIEAGIPMLIADGSAKTITAMVQCSEIEITGSVSANFIVNNTSALTESTELNEDEEDILHEEEIPGKPSGESEELEDDEDKTEVDPEDLGSIDGSEVSSEELEYDQDKTEEELEDIDSIEETEALGEEVEGDEALEIVSPLSLSITDDPDPVAAGQSVTYAIDYSNNGEELLTGVFLTAFIPEGTVFVSASAGAQIQNKKIVWNIGELAPAESGNASFIVHVPHNTEDGTIFIMTATIAADNVPSVTASESTLDPIPYGAQMFYTLGWMPDILALLSSGSSPAYDVNASQGINSILSISSGAHGTPVEVYIKNYADPTPFDPINPGSNTNLISFTLDPGKVHTIESLIHLNYNPDPLDPSTWKIAGGDLIYVLGGPVNVISGYWPAQSDGAIWAEAWNLYPVHMWDTEYIVPAGKDTFGKAGNTGLGRDFDYTDLVIQASEDGTNIVIFDPLTGLSTSITLNKGESYIYKAPELSTYSTSLKNNIGPSTDPIDCNYSNWSNFENPGYLKIDNEIIYYTNKERLPSSWPYNTIRFSGLTRGAAGTTAASHSSGAIVSQAFINFSQIHQNTTISSNRPIQAGLMTSSGARVDTRNYNLSSKELFGTEYYIPVNAGNTAGGTRLYIYAYEDGTEVKVYSSETSFTTINLNAGQVNSSYIMVPGNAVHVTSNKVIQVMGAVDSNSPDKDWGFHAIDVKYYSSSYVTPHAPGGPTGNWNPLHVTPIADRTRVYVDWNGDGIADLPYGGAPNHYVDLGRFEIGLLWNSFTGDNSGAHIWAKNIDTGEDALIVVYYGEHQGAHSQQGLDWGYVLMPLSAPFIAPPLAINKTSDPATGSSVSSGDIITYTLSFKNNGESVATNVVVKDSIPANTILNTINDGGSESGGVITWDIGTLDPGESKSVSFTVTVNESLSIGTVITNYGTIKADFSDEIKSNETKHYVGEPELIIEKSSVPPHGSVVNPGQEITYDVSYSNIGGNIAENVIITDTIPENTTLVAGSIVGPGTVTGNVITWNIGTLAANSSGFVRFKVTANDPLPSGVTEIINFATIDSDSTDPLDSNTVKHFIGAPAISLEKSANVTTIEIGGTITYTYTVTNTGNVTLTNVSVVDTPLGAVTLAETTLLPGESTTGTLTKTVTEADLPGPVTNTAIAKGTPPVGEDVTDDDDASVAITTSPAISLEKSANVASALVGSAITYTYIIENIGNTTVTIQSLVDDKIPGLSIAGLDKTVLAPGEIATATATYTVLASDLPGPLVNTAIVEGIDPTGKDVSDEDSASVGIIAVEGIMEEIEVETIVDEPIVRVVSIVPVIEVLALPFTGMNPIIPLSGLAVLFIGGIFVLVFFKRKERRLDKK